MNKALTVWPKRTYHHNAEAYVLVYRDKVREVEPANDADSRYPTRRDLRDAQSKMKTMPDHKVFWGGVFITRENPTTLMWVCSCEACSCVGDRCENCGQKRSKVHGW